PITQGGDARQRGVRAAVSPVTDPTSTARSARAAAASGDPVVTTSPTTTTGAPATERAPARASRIGPARRSSSDRPVCGGPALRASHGRDGPPPTPPPPRAPSSG